MCGGGRGGGIYSATGGQGSCLIQPDVDIKATLMLLRTVIGYLTVQILVSIPALQAPPPSLLLGIACV